MRDYARAVRAPAGERSPATAREPANPDTADRGGDLPGPDGRAGRRGDVRELLADVSGLKRSVGFRIPEGELSCVVGIGSALWDRLFGSARGRPSCTRSPASRAQTHGAGHARATCCFTSAPTASTCASSWPQRLMDRLERRRARGRRGPRLPLLRRARPARLRRRHREPRGRAAADGGPRSATRIPKFAGGSYVDRAEVRARPDAAGMR